MKIFKILTILALCFPSVFAQKNSGIFYSTLFSKEGIYTRIKEFGNSSAYHFLKDVNNDGLDDAIVVYTEGNEAGKVYVGLSDGICFKKPYNALTWRVPFDYVTPIMGDLNGDGKIDIIYFDRTLMRIYVAFSNGISFDSPETFPLKKAAEKIAEGFLADINGDEKDEFVYSTKDSNNRLKWYFAIFDNAQLSSSICLIEDFGTDATQKFTGDVNGDGKADIIAFYKETGLWKVALSDGKRCIENGVWAEHFKTPTPYSRKVVSVIGFWEKQNNEEAEPMVYDVDQDGKDDIILWDHDNWMVKYSNGDKFDQEHDWISYHLHHQHKYGAKGAQYGLIGLINGKDPSATVISYGRWCALENTDKNKTVLGDDIDVWESGSNDYIPAIGTYDPFDSIVIDRQLKMIHNAGFTYIMFDITNSDNSRIDDRAKFIITRIREFNKIINKNERRLGFCISMGARRDSKAIEEESERTWNDFFLPYKDVYHFEDGKPLIIHFVNGPDNVILFNNYRKENRTPFADKFELRWMLGVVLNKPEYANAYGWPIPEKYGNPEGRKVMAVMPGFYNGGMNPIARENGDFYRSQWMRVIQFQPKSVWVNSFNETWEHTSVEPAFQKIDQFVAHPSFSQPWTDYYGNRMDDFYWIMTYQYNKLFMDNVLLEGIYFQEYGNSQIWKVSNRSFIKERVFPVMTPVLLLPQRFRENFNGIIVKDNNERIWNPITN